MARRKSKKNPSFDLIMKEAAMVAAVGAGLTYLTNWMLDEPIEVPVLLAGMGLYGVGVLAGMNKAEWPQVG